MSNKLRKLLETQPIEASAPCRIDMGGTLDIPIFYYPLRYLSPCTFNIALEHRTRVRLLPYTGNLVKISSAGFEDAEFPQDSAPFNHPLGLMFATAAYFNAGGVHIEIESASPPRSALGGSSSATVALVAAFLRSNQQDLKKRNVLNRRKIALLPTREEIIRRLERRWRASGIDAVAERIYIHYLEGAIDVEIVLPLATVESLEAAERLSERLVEATRQERHIREVDVLFR